MAITRSQIARQLLQQGGVSMVDPRMQRSLEENIARNNAAREINQAMRKPGGLRNLYTKYGTYHPPMAFYNASLEINNRLDGSIGDTWFESGLSNNRYKYEDQEWYRQIPDNSKNGWSKKQKMTLDQVKSDLSLMDYNYILFPEIDLSGMKGGNN